MLFFRFVVSHAPLWTFEEQLPHTIPPDRRSDLGISKLPGPQVGNMLILKVKAGVADFEGKSWWMVHYTMETGGTSRISSPPFLTAYGAAA